MVSFISDYGIFIKPPYILGQFLGNNLVDILKGVAIQANELEQAFFDILTKTTLTNAVGAQLDVIGVDLVFARTAGLSDSDYRVILQNKELLITASGEPENIILYLEKVLGYTDVQLTFQTLTKLLDGLTLLDGGSLLSAFTGPARYEVSATGDNNIGNYLALISPSGVEYIINYHLETEDGFDLLTEAGDYIITEQL